MCQARKTLFIKVQFTYSNILPASFDRSTQVHHNSIMEQFYHSKYFPVLLKATSFCDPSSSWQTLICFLFLQFSHFSHILWILSKICNNNIILVAEKELTEYFFWLFHYFHLFILFAVSDNSISFSFLINTEPYNKMSRKKKKTAAIKSGD